MQPKDTGNSYDKIFKENAESIFLPLIALKMGIQISWYKPLKEKLQSTVEREMDLCYEVHTDTGEKFLLNLEFQTRHDPQMIYRMAEYHSMALRKKKLPIKHVVLYLGTRRQSWKVKLDDSEVFTGFELLNLHDLDPQELLSSQIPEVVLLAVLSNYPKEQSEALLRSLYQRLRSISKTNQDLSKFLKQLLILSRLRKIEDILIKINQEMPITIEIEKDYLYQKGIEKGIEAGRAFTVISAFSNGIDLQTIAKITQLSVEEIFAILKSKGLNPNS